MTCFVLCNDYDWKEKYRKDNHKYNRLLRAEELLGFPKIRVLVHENWQDSCDWEGIDYLEQQVEILARFNVINLVYINDEGGEEYMAVEEMMIPVSPQLGLEENIDLGQHTATVAYEREDMDCPDGACKI